MEQRDRNSRQGETINVEKETLQEHKGPQVASQKPTSATPSADSSAQGPATTRAGPIAVPAQLPIHTQPPKSGGRRDFLRVLFAIGALLTIVPFVPWGEYLSSSVTSPGSYAKQKVVTDVNKLNGAGSGNPVNVNDLATFPPNGGWLVTYPSSGDLTVDSQNPDTFVKWQLIRLPTELGGGNGDASAFVAFSKVCVHLWCSPNYNPEQCRNPSESGYQSGPNCTTHEQYECPCHGSIYRIPDGLSIAGPASLQPPPTNAIPLLTLSTDAAGYLYVEPPIFDVNHNGVIGYGRSVPGVTEPLTSADNQYKQGSPYTNFDNLFNGK